MERDQEITLNLKCKKLKTDDDMQIIGQVSRLPMPKEREVDRLIEEKLLKINEDIIININNNEFVVTKGNLLL